MTNRTHVATNTEQRSCDRHGSYEATLWDIQPKPVGYDDGVSDELLTFLRPFWSRCPSCDSEMQREADEQHAQIRSGKTQNAALLAARFAEAHIPKRLDECTLDNYSTLLPGEKTALGAARDYAYSFETVIETGRSMVFLGRVGTGKGHLSVGILRHVMLRGGTGLFVTAFEILAAVKATFARGSTRTIEQVVEAYVRPDLLVIDEVGKQTGSDFEIANLFAVIDKRYADEKPMILISNLNEADFKALMGEPIVDRIRSKGGRLVKFFWESRRGEDA